MTLDRVYYRRGQNEHRKAHFVVRQLPFGPSAAVAPRRLRVTAQRRPSYL